MSNKLSSAEIGIELALSPTTCTMICPSYKYKDEIGTPIESRKIAWAPGNLELLEKTISKVMVENYQAQLAGALTDIAPIAYIDCSQKGDKNLMFFIMEKILERYAVTGTDDILQEVIRTTSMLNDPEKQQLREKKGDILNNYYEMFNQLLQNTENDEGKTYLIKCENAVPLSVMSEILENNGKRAYAYLDHIQDLTSLEQQQINLLLYTRGALDIGNERLYLKINNGTDNRCTRTTINGKRAQSTHDYGETNIRETELPKGGLIETENIYKNAQTAEELYSILSPYVERLYYFSQLKKIEIAEMAKHFLEEAMDLREKIAAKEIIQLTKRNEYIDKIAKNKEKWLLKDIENYYSDDQEQAAFAARAVALSEKAIDMIIDMAPRLYGKMTRSIYNHIKEHFGDTKTITIDAIAHLRECVFKHIRTNVSSGNLTALLSETKISRENILMTITKTEDSQKMTYSGIGPFLIRYCFDQNNQQVSFQSLYAALKEIEHRLGEAVLEADSFKYVSPYFQDYLMLYQERNKLGNLTADPENLQENVSILKPKSE